jgi:uncharacterized membrane protein YcjF (UPF0283 family)
MKVIEKKKRKRFYFNKYFLFLKKMLFGKNIWLVGEKYVMNVLQHFLIIIICVNNVVIWLALNVQINSHN